MSFNFNFSQQPIIVHVWHHWFRNHDLGILNVKLLLTLLHVVDGQYWRLLTQQFLTSFVKLLSLFFTLNEALKLMIVFDGLSIISRKFLTLLKAVSLSIFGSSLLLLDLLLSVFSVALCDGLASHNILFPQSVGSSQPPEQFSKGMFVSVNILLIVAFN